MTIGRQAFRTALLLTCSTFSLTAFSPSAFSQAPPPVENPQAAQTDDQQGSDERRQRGQAAGEQAAEAQATDLDTGGEQQPRARFADEAELAQPKVWLGIGLKEVSGDLAAYLGSTKGVLVESVFPDSPAKAAGIQEGDIIIAINGERVANPRALIEALLKLDSAKKPPHKTDEQQRRDAEQKRKEAEQKEEADRQEKDADQEEADKQDEKKQDDIAKKKATYPPIKLTLLRQGKEINVEVTPTERPESLAIPEATAELGPDAEIAELEEMLRELESQGGARVFRFGPPARIGEPAAGLAAKRIENLVIIVKDASGEATEVRIQRVGDAPAKITVREGDKTREVTEDEIDQLPEKVRDVVRQALKTQEDARAAEESRGAAAREKIESEIREQIDRAQRDLRGGPRQRMETHRRLRDQLHELPGGHITILSPEELRKMGKSAEELAAKYQKLAEEMARRGVQKAQDLAALPDEVKELQAQVDELKKQVEELRAQIKAGKP